MRLGEQQELRRRHVQRQDELLDHRLAAEQSEHGGEGPGADEQVAHHRRGPGRQVDRLLQHLVVERAVGGGQENAAERADAGGLRRRRQAEQDGAEHGDDQDGEREERGRERPKHLGARNIGLLLGQLGGERRIDHRPRDHVEDVEAGQQEARHEGGRIELDGRYAGCCGVHDQENARRDEDAETAARAHHAGRELDVVAGAQHGGKREQAHQRHHRADDAGCRRKHGAGEQRRHGERAGHVLHGDLQRVEQAVEDVGSFDQVAHEQE